MTPRTALVATLVAGAIFMPPLVTRASAQGFEIGTSLASATFGTGDNDPKVFGVPSSSFGLLSPSVYGSIFMGSYVAVEPQLGLIWVSADGEDLHILNIAAQFDYFLQGKDAASPYLFVSAGVVDVSDADTNPKSVSGGAGYRMRVGDRLTFRVDGRVTHFTDGGSNAVAFGFSIGGLFGQ